MIIVTAKMLARPRHDVTRSTGSRGSSQPDEKTRNIRDAIQALKAVASRLVEALVNVRGLI